MQNDDSSASDYKSSPHSSDDEESKHFSDSDQEKIKQKTKLKRKSSDNIRKNYLKNKKSIRSDKDNLQKDEDEEEEFQQDEELVIHGRKTPAHIKGVLQGKIKQEEQQVVLKKKSDASNQKKEYDGVGISFDPQLYGKQN